MNNYQGMQASFVFSEARDVVEVAQKGVRIEIPVPDLVGAVAHLVRRRRRRLVEHQMQAASDFEIVGLAEDKTATR